MTPNGQLVRAADADKGSIYLCPICNQELVLRRGKQKRPHFAHKVLTQDCTPETALHYSFKTLLTQKIQHHIDTNSPLEIRWLCEHCSRCHVGNLLKRAVRVELEYDLGVCKPDIALLDQTNRAIAVIEIVVTHKPEEKVLEYYQQNSITLVQYDLTSDENLQRLDHACLDPNYVALCLNPKCRHCKEYLYKKSLLIIDGQCWKCSKSMKVAALTGEGGYIGNEDLISSEIELANQRGANLVPRYSKTVRERYVANTCRNCASFVGNHYLFTDYIAMPHYPREEIEVGYYCPNCITN
ncbi:hypothetical protein H6F88_19210 [Oculatella sp. FACHB-28]|uniref:competence protein CoiA family protein n=1 Tax=Oculatella sp. FACHB-28 TaxID=2692845 RepID=UPI0016866EAF|nr:competence protein CoiA family protein [Oculatella sp. FACHB-28]MBD2058115.1 hypothetical protein [Oculatella sp. FACHB-28]